MTEEEFLTAQGNMTAALDRATKIVGCISGDEDTARVELYEDGTAAVISWRAETDYDSPTLERYVQPFDRELLFVAEAHLADWLADKKERERVERNQRELERQQKTEAEQRALLATLKARYGE